MEVEDLTLASDHDLSLADVDRFLSLVRLSPGMVAVHGGGEGLGVADGGVADEREGVRGGGGSGVGADGAPRGDAGGARAAAAGPRGAGAAAAGRGRDEPVLLRAVALPAPTRLTSSLSNCHSAGAIRTTKLAWIARRTDRRLGREPGFRSVAAAAAAAAAAAEVRGRRRERRGAAAAEHVGGGLGAALVCVGGCAARPPRRGPCGSCARRRDMPLWCITALEFKFPARFDAYDPGPQSGPQVRGDGCSDD
jgi:hypothetical protein